MVRLCGVRVLVFDLDDTLYPERSYARSGFEAVATWLRGKIQCPTDLAARMTALMDTEHRSKVFDRILAELGMSPDPSLVAEMIQCYRNHTPRIRLFEDADRALRRWQHRYRLALITDGLMQVQQKKIETLGIEAFFNPIIYTDRWGREYWKPHPHAFETVQTEVNCPPSACVYLADNAGKDFLAPRQLGWQTVQVLRADGLYADVAPPPGGEPDHRITSLDEIEIAG